MSKILVKGIVLYGLYSRIYDSTDEPRPLDVERTYKTIDEFLRKKGQPIVPEMIRPLPFIEDGFITSSAAVSFYTINNCLIANGFRPYFGRDAHIIQAATRLEDKLKIDETFNFLKIEAGWQWIKYWGDYDEKIINVPEQLRSIKELVSYIPKLLLD